MSPKKPDPTSTEELDPSKPMPGFEHVAPPEPEPVLPRDADEELAQMERDQEASRAAYRDG